MRLFIAVPVPALFADRLDSLLSDRRGTFPPASWPRPASIHLTLAFLGEQDDRTLPCISTALSSAVSPIRSFTALPSVFGVFPDERRARIGWIGLEPRGLLDDLDSRIRRALFRESISFDDKPFVPHLTVVRMRAPWNRDEVSRFVGTRLPEDLRFEVQGVVLYRSVLTPSGAIHSEEESFPLRTDNLAVPRF